MSNLSCCEGSSWLAELDLGRAEGFEFDLGKCSGCGAAWMSVYCAGSGWFSYEPVLPGDAERIRSLAAGAERTSYVKAWADRNT